MKTIIIAVNSLNNMDRLVPIVEDLGRRHKDDGVLPKHYDTVAVALIDTLGKGLGGDFTSATKDAWVAVYTVLSTTMQGAYEYD